MAFQNGQYRIQNGATLKQNLIVPKAQNRITLAGQPNGSRLVFHVLTMLIAIQFNNQFFLSANEIRYVIPDPNLSRKSVSIQVSVS